MCTRPFRPLPAPGRHDPLGPVHRRAGQPGHARLVPPISGRSPAWPGPSRPSWRRLIRSTGFFRAKARNLLAMANQVVERHGGEIPIDLAALTALNGVGRKTANVVLGTAFGVAEGVVVDTHVKRLARRLGLSMGKTPEQIERDLMRRSRGRTGSISATA